MDTMIKKKVANENFYRRMLMELGDVMQHVVNDDLEVEGVNESNYHIALKSKKFKFAVPAKADMMPLLHFIIDGKDPSRESSDVYGSHAFYSVSEFEELLNLIASDGLKEKIKNKTIDKLFK